MSVNTAQFLICVRSFEKPKVLRKREEEVDFLSIVDGRSRFIRGVFRAPPNIINKATSQGIIHLVRTQIIPKN